MYRYFLRILGEKKKKQRFNKSPVALARHEKHQGYSSYIVLE
jgi:hypothetical protein